MTVNREEPLGRLQLSPTVTAALEVAVAESEGRPTGTLDILLAVLTLDLTWGWESVQIAASFVTEGDLQRFADPHPQADGAYDGARLSASATHALRVAADVAATYEMELMPTGVLVLGLLADPDSAASAALLKNSAIDHARLLELIQENVLDTNLEGLELAPLVAAEAQDAAPAADSPPQAHTVAQEPKPDAEARAGRLGFDIGTFLGAFAVSLIGGLPLAFALGLAFGVRTAAVRVRRRRRDGLLASLAASALIVAFILAITAITGFGETREAVGKLNAARTEIGEDHLVAAMKNLADADLLEQESESVTVLASCVDWDLGFKDYALFEAQVALGLGYEPEAETHYRGRDCYLDISDLAGIGYLKIGTSWFVYPQPDKTDAPGRQLLAIAQDSDSPRSGDRVVALGCLSDRYDMRFLAGFDFTIGLDWNLRNEAGGTPYAAIRSCIENKDMGQRYSVHVDPMTGIEEFLPTDGSERIPSPRRHTPPDVCWARFPTGGPCGADG